MLVPKPSFLAGEANGSFEATKENPRIFRDGHEGEQTMAGVSRIALRAARLDVEKNQTGFSLARKNPSPL